MSKPTILDEDIEDLKFARQCVEDMQRAANYLEHRNSRFSRAILKIDQILLHHANTATRKERRKKEKEQKL